MTDAEQKVFDAVALAIANVCPVLLVPSELRKMTTAAVAAIYANEVCAGCGCQLAGAAMCVQCASDEGKNARAGQQ